MTLRKSKSCWKLKEEPPDHSQWRTFFWKRLWTCRKKRCMTNEFQSFKTLTERSLRLSTLFCHPRLKILWSCNKIMKAHCVLVTITNQWFQICLFKDSSAIPGNHDELGAGKNDSDLQQVLHPSANTSAVYLNH